MPDRHQASASAPPWVKMALRWRPATRAVPRASGKHSAPATDDVPGCEGQLGSVTELSMAKARHRQNAAAACRRQVDAPTRRGVGVAVAGQWSGARRSISMLAARQARKATASGNGGFGAVPSAATSLSGIA